ncbi:hypothetical protein GOODEAATRI_005337, partial [Goodea atripinnis]
EPPTPSTEINQVFLPVTYSPYSLEFMARLLKRGKVLTDLVIHLLSSRGSPEQTLEVLSQLRDWKVEWGCYSPSSLTVEIIEAERQKIIKETTTPAYALASAGDSADAATQATVVGSSKASDLSSSSPDSACTKKTSDAPALGFAGGQSSPSAPVPELQHTANF